MPFIIRWPGKINAGVSNALVSQIDFIASFADLLDIKLKPTEAPDSRNTLQAFMGKDKKGLEFTLEEAGKMIAIRYNDWKYIPTKKRAQLFDLSKDKEEKHNLISDNPEIAKKLAAKLNSLRKNGRLRN